MATSQSSQDFSLIIKFLIYCASFFVLTAFVPVWNKFALLGYFFCLLILAVGSPLAGFLAVSFFSLWIGFVRWEDSANLIPSVFDSLSVIILLAGVTLSFILKGKSVPRGLKFFRGGWSVLGCLFCIALLNVLLVVDVFLRSNSWLELFLKCREYLIPALIFFPAVYAFRLGGRSADLYIKIITLSGGVIALINLFHYFVGLPIFIPRFVPVHGVEDAYVARELLGFSFFRMHHIFGLSTQGGGGAIYIGIALISLVLLITENKNKFVWGASALLSLLCAVLIVSFSALLVVCLFVVSAASFISMRHPVAMLVLFPTVLVFIWLAGWGEFISAQGELSLYQYIYSFTDERILKDLSAFFSSGSAILGDGLGLKSGGGVGLADLPNSDRHDQLFDQWIFVVLYQLGVVAFLCVLVSYCFVFSYFFRVLGVRRVEWRTPCCFYILLLVCVAFVHGAAPIERLFSPMFYTVLAYCFSVSTMQGSHNVVREE
ncbi:hypothetical protein ACIGKL_21635 [Pseudomonas sp. NPDC077186]|uniref:hypothetical protein n=1 Tax=Pseudomonas sp. NPDC077186 TaxID=3364421 RepID=UPI0037C8D49E